MKKITAFCLISLFIFTLTNNLYSEITESAKTLDPNTFSIGFHPQIYTKNNDIRGSLGLAYGLVDNIDTKFRVGMGLDKLYMGINISYQLVYSKYLDFATSIGYHYDSNIFFDYFFNISSSFVYFDIYNGLKFKYQLTNQNELGSSYFLGFIVNLNNDNKIILESGFNLLNYYDWVSIGISSLIK